MPARKKTAKPIAPARPVTSDPDVQSVERLLRIGIAAIKARDFDAGREASQGAPVGLLRVEDWVITGKASRASNSKGGKGRGQQRKDDAALAAKAIRDTATDLLSAHAPRDISGILMQRGYGSRTKILRALRSHPLGHWAPRQKK
jgi:hypothetical protein